MRFPSLHTKCVSFHTHQAESARWVQSSLQNCGPICLMSLFCCPDFGSGASISGENADSVPGNARCSAKSVDGQHHRAEIDSSMTPTRRRSDRDPVPFTCHRTVSILMLHSHPLSLHVELSQFHVHSPLFRPSAIIFLSGWCLGDTHAQYVLCPRQGCGRSSVCLVTRLTGGKSRVRFPAREGDFFPPKL